MIAIPPRNAAEYLEYAAEFGRPFIEVHSQDKPGRGRFDLEPRKDLQ